MSECDSSDHPVLVVVVIVIVVLFLKKIRLLSNCCKEELQILCVGFLGEPLLSLSNPGGYPKFSWNYR